MYIRIDVYICVYICISYVETKFPHIISQNEIPKTTTRGPPSGGTLLTTPTMQNKELGKLFAGLRAELRAKMRAEIRAGISAQNAWGHRGMPRAPTREHQIRIQNRWPLAMLPSQWGEVVVVVAATFRMAANILIIVRNRNLL